MIDFGRKYPTLVAFLQREFGGDEARAKEEMIDWPADPVPVLADHRAQAFNEMVRLHNGTVAERRAKLTHSEDRKWERLMTEQQRVGDFVREIATERDRKTAERAGLDRERAPYESTVRPEESSGTRYGGIGLVRSRPQDPEFRSLLDGETMTISVEEIFDRDRANRSVSETRDLFVGSGGGANWQPSSFRDQVIANLRTQTALLAINEITRISTDSGEPLVLPIRTAVGAGTLVPEGTVIPEGDPTLNKVTLNAYKYSNIVTVSNEMLTDSMVDMSSFVARDLGEAVGWIAGSALMLGSGSNQPQGLMTGTGGTASSATATLTYSDLIDFFFTLGASYRQNAVTIASDSVIKSIRKLKDSNGSPLLELGGPVVGPGNVTALMGRPLYVDAFLPAAGTANLNAVVFDPARFIVRDAGGVQIARSADYAFNKDETAFRCVFRVDSRVTHGEPAIALRAGTA